MNPRIKIIISVLSIAALMLVSAGCDVYILDDDPCYCCDGAPPVPSGVHSVTGDGCIYVYWNPVSSHDCAGYDVYRGAAPTGYYEYMGSVRCASFNDVSVQNGVTYYYAIASYDDCGNASELSTDLIYDTPRPEGHSYYLWASEYYSEDGGYDFSEYSVVGWDYPTCDFFFGHDSLGYYLCAANDYTDILDYGYATSLSDVDVAPEDGWSSSAAIDAIEGHAYVIWTADNHFATVLVRDIAGERLTFDWAYQTDTGNPELRPSPSVIDRRKNRISNRGLLAASSKGE